MNRRYWMLLVLGIALSGSSVLASADDKGTEANVVTPEAAAKAATAKAAAAKKAAVEATAELKAADEAAAKAADEKKVADEKAAAEKKAADEKVADEKKANVDKKKKDDDKKETPKGDKKDDKKKKEEAKDGDKAVDKAADDAVDPNATWNPGKVMGYEAARWKHNVYAVKEGFTKLESYKSFLKTHYPELGGAAIGTLATLMLDGYLMDSMGDEGLAEGDERTSKIATAIGSILGASLVNAEHPVEAGDPEGYSRRQKLTLVAIASLLRGAIYLACKEAGDYNSEEIEEPDHYGNVLLAAKQVGLFGTAAGVSYGATYGIGMIPTSFGGDKDAKAAPAV